MLIFQGDYFVQNEFYEGSGLIHTVTGSDNRRFAEFQSYEPTSKPRKIQFGSGSITSYTYNQTTRRLRRIFTQSPSGASLQDRWYAYNKTDDIPRTYDANTCALFDFSYDNLHLDEP